MGGSSKPSTQTVERTSTTKSEPWGPSQEHLKTIMDEAGLAYGRPKVWPSFQTYTDFDPIQLEGLQATAARARAGSPQIPAAQAFNLAAMEGIENPIIPSFLETARGDFLTGPNPYMEQALDPAYDRVLGQFSAAGRLGSDYNRAEMVRAAAPFLLGEYGRERALQEGAKSQLANIYEQGIARQAFAAQQAPGMAALDYIDPNILTGVGGVYRNQADLELAQRVQEFDFLANERQRALSAYAGIVTPISGQGGSQFTSEQVPMISGGGGSSKLDTALKAAQVAATVIGMCDYRLKDNIEDLPSGALDTVLQLKPKRYNYRAEYGFDPSTTEGFLAHEVQDVLPDAVIGTHNGAAPQLLNVLSVLATVTKAMQELSAKVDRLEKRLETNHGS